MNIKLLIQSSIGCICIILVCFYGIGCSHAKEETQANSDKRSKSQIILSIPDTLKPGVLYPNVLINNDQLNSFALYLPKLYRSNTNWPTVFFFDPSGNGSLPLSKYKSLADSLGYILIGSNVSKNGQDVEEALVIWNALKNICFNNLSIDRNRLILAGFSGGARVCCAIASKEGIISGIIANSAGAQQLEELLNQNTFFIGLAGNCDMNRAEMLGIEQHLISTTLTHFYIEFDGTHEWAPFQTMQKALMLASMNAYLKNPNAVDVSLIENFISNQTKEIQKLKIENKWLDAYDQLKLLNYGAKGLNTLPIEDMDSIENHESYIAQKSENLKLIAQETQMQQELYKLMQDNPNIILWKSKIDLIRKNSIQKNKTGQMNQRILGYASLVCYSLSNRNLVAKNYALTEKMVNCYEIVDPQNSEVYFLKAVLSGAKADSINTNLNLKKCLKLGFNDKKRISNQLDFNFLNDDKTFKEILN
jgi:hypothetical protein